MPLFNQITIIGIGLIGGSLAKAIKRKRLCNKVVGFFRNKSKLNTAIKEKIVDSGYLNLEASIKGSELIILALPIKNIIACMPKIKKVSGKKSIVIDVGSTKDKIARAADRLGLNFLGTHPLAGSEKKGANFSSSKLFEGSKVIITPRNKTKKETIDKIKTFWRKLDTSIFVLSPQQHDKIIAFTSHLPHLVSFSLVKSIPGQYLPFGASGLKDTTRIALSDPGIWSEIFLSNNEELLKSLSVFRKELKEAERSIRANKKNKLTQSINIARKKRKTIE